MWGRKPRLPSKSAPVPEQEIQGDRSKVMPLLSISWNMRVPKLYVLLITTGLLVLCMEWIYPVTSSGQAGSERFAAVMAGYSAVLLSVGMLRIGWIASILIRIPVIYIALCVMYGGSHPMEWGISYPGLLDADLGEWIDKGHFRVMSKETRGMFMLCGWSMLIASVQYLVLLRRSISLFATGTLVYLILLESLVGYDAYSSVVRSVCWLLCIQGMLHLLRLTEETGTGQAKTEASTRGEALHHVKTSLYGMRSKVYWSWVAASLGTVACVVLISTIPARMSFVSPAGQISLMDTVERLAKWSGYNPSDSVPASLGVTGYSTVDAPMGAPLVQGNDPVFTANTPVSTYWRGETRSYYNGSNWSDVEQHFRYVSSSGLLRSDGWEDHPYWQRVRQIITMELEWRGPNPLFTGGLPVSLSFQDGNIVNEQNEKRLLSNEDNGTLWLAGGSKRSTQHYTVDVMVPDVTPDELRQLVKTGKSADPAVVRRKDLQLPDHLPQRVRDLSAEIIGPTATRYDAVQAVRSYLKANARYSLDTRMPPRGTDFVDDFLFVTREGYCNHFSTAMVVLLRAEGIPARWVKGYAPGQADPQVPGRVVVTQSDAHSWVEVYFPGAGWMPFEATPGFDSAQAADASAASSAGLQPGDGTPLPDAGSGLDRASAWLAARARALVAAPWLTATALAAAALLCAAAWACALRLRPALRLGLLLAWPRSSFPDRERLLRAAAPVWHALARQYGPRPLGMTLREYAASPALAAGTDSADIARFAADWERLLYGPDRPLRADSLDFLRRALRLTRRTRRSLRLKS
ncbi:MAG: transglutaminase domain-containing protein [Paenibacillus sp.]|uniref:DUF4129 domain-containing transglutaminase family protein n=1 Tax=Paenibacillus sp. TaxID=58172 RepID=UPI0025DB3BB7|nr:transglutaminase domain-containing protein [Paenibacillus sp.]MBR2564324.1 transglutaminase domain-containing protein [Paenibacillus sp.]